MKEGMCMDREDWNVHLRQARRSRGFPLVAGRGGANVYVI